MDATTAIRFHTVNGNCAYLIMNSCQCAPMRSVSSIPNAELIILFAVYAALDGVFALITGLETPKDTPGRGSLILRGLIGIVASVIAFSYPGITAISLLFLIGAWAIFSGGVEIGAAFLLRHELTNEFLLLIAGGLSILFGVLMFMNPSAGALSVVWLIGSYAIVYGIMLLTLAFKLKRLGGDIRTATGDLTGSLEQR